MKTILVTGRTGQVGRELVRCLEPLGRVIATGRQDLDLTSPDSIRSAVRRHAPDIIVNAAAYTAVDKAESEPDLAMRINAVAPGVLAEEAKRANALLVHYSTDYIFDGLLGRPYVEEDAPNPQPGAGEVLVRISRTALCGSDFKLWHKGAESGHVQHVREIRLDCDGDVVVLEVQQVGGIACHTGRGRCFFRRLDNGNWVVTEPVIRDPREIYKSKP